MNSIHVIIKGHISLIIYMRYEKHTIFLQELFNEISSILFFISNLWEKGYSY